MAASAIKSALPQHLKPGNGDDGEFAKRHHGKTRSHMVSLIILLFPSFTFLPKFGFRFGLNGERVDVSTFRNKEGEVR
jgi:hypothetical protein